MNQKILAFVVLFATLPFSRQVRAAGINFAGGETNLGSGWRTPSIQKPLDIDGDNILGTDGYYLANLPPVLPGYVSQAAILTSVYTGNTNYAFIDDPTHPGNIFETGAMNPAPGSGASASLFSFTVNSTVAGRSIRIGLLIDNLDYADFNAASLELARTNGAGGASGPIATTTSSLNDRVPDWLFFDIPTPAAGDVFVISGVGGTNGTATLGGVSFDSISTLVINTNDSGAGSLRTIASTAPNGSTITFAPNLSGQTITLASPVTLVNSVTIDATALPGGLTLSGGGSSQIIMINSGASNTLLGLTFSQGYASDTGGAIYSASGSSLHIAGCTFTGNTGFEGGALLNDGALLVENSTFSGNTAGYGGALQCRYLTTLNQCTIVSNSAGNGGGGVFNKYSTLTLNNCIVAENLPAMPGCDIYSQLAALAFTGSNLAGSIVEDRPSASDTGPAPLTNAPLLAPLGNYGGSTQTMLPLPNSPAIDAGGSATLTTDQRGLARVVGAAPDLGAAEYQDASSVVSNTADSGAGSLRFAATYTTNGQVITFDPGLDGATIRLTSGQILLKPNLTIDASALAGGIQIDGNNNNRIFQVNNGSAEVLNSLTITNGNGTGGTSSTTGGGILSIGLANRLTLNNCLVTGNHVSMFGGGLGTAFGTVTINGTTFSGNTGSVGAGASIQGSVGTFTGCTFNGNSGTALQLLGAAQPVTLSIINSTFTGNTASTGAAVALSSGSGTPATALLTNCTITGNATILAGQPGAIWLQSGSGSGTNSVYLYNTIISGNTSGAAASDITATLNAKVIVSGSYNLLGTGAGLTNAINGNKVGINNPQLAPLGNYGGLTQTMPPLPGSPAVDAGGPTPLSTDQRGFSRDLGAAPDIGAVEGIFDAAGIGVLIGNVTGLGNGQIQFSYTHFTDTSFTVLATTNLALPPAEWINLGPALETPAGSGHFQFIDPQATNYPQRFYRIRSP